MEDSSSRLSASCPGKSDPSPGEDSTKSLAAVLAALPPPPGGHKRKHSGDGPSTNFRPPTKLLRAGRSSVPKLDLSLLADDSHRSISPLNISSEETYFCCLSMSLFDLSKKINQGFGVSVGFSLSLGLPIICFDN